MSIIWEQCANHSFTKPKHCTMDELTILDGQQYPQGTQFIAYESVNHSIIELAQSALDVHGMKPRFYFHRF